MNNVILFGTDGCHLCEDAEAILKQLAIEFDAVDICDNDQHAELYGIRIPVLKNDRGDELNWPFDQAAVIEFLN